VSTDVEQERRRAEAIAELRTRSMYEAIGGEHVLRSVVDRFYDLMHSEPEFTEVRAMHKADLGYMRQSLFEFFSGWLGGPNLYIEKHGSPCLTGVHLPLGIDDTTEQQWMDCMQRAMDEAGVPLKFSELLMPSMRGLAEGMRLRLPG